MRCLWLEDQRLTFRENVPTPEPGRGEALVRVRLAGICGTDVELLRGYYPYTGIPGHEFVGEVAAAPDDVSWEGKRVVGEINAACGECDTCRAGRPTHCERRTVLGIAGRDGALAQYLCLPLANLRLCWHRESRTFEKGTKDKFLKRVRSQLPLFAHIESQDEFDYLHTEICRWGSRSLKPSHAGRPRASYGQVAKTLNVVLKVAVYYCGLPSRRQATRLLPWLHHAIDKPMMKYLQSRYRDEFPRGVKTIADVDKRISATSRPVTPWRTSASSTPSGGRTSCGRRSTGRRSRLLCSSGFHRFPLPE